MASLTQADALYFCPFFFWQGAPRAADDKVVGSALREDDAPDRLRLMSLHAVSDFPPERRKFWRRPRLHICSTPTSSSGPSWR